MNIEEAKGSTFRHKYKWHLLAGTFLLTIFVWYVVSREDRRGILTVAFLDVGQGDAIFIEAPNGNQILLDGGSNKKILKSLGAVMPFYDRTIDLLVLSHPHIDHFGGFLSVLARYRVGGYLNSGTIAKTPEFESLQNGLQVGAIKSIVARRGMKIDMSDGVVLSVLLPDRDVASADPHDGMLVVKLDYGNTSVILTGDMQEDLENYLVFLEGDNLKSEVLKVGHHGSKTSTSKSFLGYTSSTYAVISSGKGNMYRHPHVTTMGTLDQFEVETLRTDMLGTIVMRSDGEKFSVK